MIDTQLLNDVLATVGFIVGIAVLISAWVVVAAAIHQRRARATQVGAIERHLAEVAEQESPATVR